MTIQKLLITTAAAAVLAMAATSPVHGRGNPAMPTPVKFLRSVQLPGQMLPAGDYVFEKANPESSGDVVLVRSRDGQVQWLGFTNRVTRRDGSRSAVELAEARRGEAPRVLAWFPSGALNGAAFIY